MSKSDAIIKRAMRPKTQIQITHEALQLQAFMFDDRLSCLERVYKHKLLKAIAPKRISQALGQEERKIKSIGSVASH